MNFVSLLLLLVLPYVVGKDVNAKGMKTAFLIIDVQHCFVPNGTLPVAGGDEVVGPINTILANRHFDLVVRTQDWHCADHVSFAAMHPGHAAFSSITLNYTVDGRLCDYPLYTHSKVNCSAADVNVSLSQTLWPEHCVINTTDADLLPSVAWPEDVVTVRKGYHCEVDSYSGFYNNGGFAATELQLLLQRHGINTVYIAGLATDYCVSYTAKDAARLHYETYIVMDASRAISSDTLITESIQWLELGVKQVNVSDVIAKDACVSFGYGPMMMMMEGTCAMVFGKEECEDTDGMVGGGKMFYRGMSCEVALAKHKEYRAAEERDKSRSTSAAFGNLHAASWRLPLLLTPPLVGLGVLIML